MYFNLSVEQCLKEFCTNRSTGISMLEAEKRKEKYGKNILIQKNKDSLMKLFFDEFKDLMVLILICASIIALLGNEIVDAIIIFLVVILNATIGFLQKYKAEKALEALQKMVAPKARVLRDGVEHMILATEIVPGDILLLNEGDKITADIRLIETNELQISEAILTGESLPLTKITTRLKCESISLGERINMGYMGTSVAHGTGVGIVTATGMKTEFGRIAELTTATEKDLSPLQKQMTKIGTFVGKITLVISIGLLLIGTLLEKKTFIDSLLFSVSVAVAAVPEGLPATITIALAIGVQKLAKKKAIVKQLTSAETLGSTTAICTDKTGTLTKNEMTVKECHTYDYCAKFTGIGYEPLGDIHVFSDQLIASTIKDESISFQTLCEKFPQMGFEMTYLLKTAVLCNNAKLTQEDKAYTIIGDPTEGALISMGEKAQIRDMIKSEKNTKLHEIPFDSVRKTMSVIYKDATGATTSYVKGAPEEILKNCSFVLKNGERKKITKKEIDHFSKLNTEMGGRALRVIACAYKTISSEENKISKNEAETEMTFIGLIGMIDPPREDVKEAVIKAKAAGIKIYVLTGDQSATALAIAQELSIVKNEHVRVIQGDEMENFSSKELQKLLSSNKELIFSRVSPEHKLKIVQALKENGEVVAVTGDGVNDAPALKKADIGIAMGITGTDVSKEAANMILSDDSFSTIVIAIEEGRTIYANLKKFIFYIFSCNIGELITVLLAIALSIPMPLTAILILCINLGTDTLPALALSVESSEKNTMLLPPRKSTDKLLTSEYIGRFAFIGTVIGLIVTAVFLIQLTHYGWGFGEDLSPESIAYKKGSTSAFALLIIIQMANAINARSEKSSLFSNKITNNPWLILALISTCVILILLVELPFIQVYLNTTHLTLNEWLFITLSASFVCVAEELRKLIQYRWIRGC